MFVAVRAAGNNFARCGAVDAGKIEELAFGSGVEIEKRVLASGPAVTDAFGGGASFIGSFVSGFAELSARILDCGFCPLGGFGDFFTGSFVAGALVRIVGVTTQRSGHEGASEPAEQSGELAGQWHKTLLITRS